VRAALEITEAGSTSEIDERKKGRGKKRPALRREG
jgi:hypothetical protein